MAATKRAKADAPVERVNVLENAVVVVLRFNNLGNHGSVDREKVRTDADVAMLHVGKRLLDSPEYRDVQNNRYRWRDWLRTRALPSMLKGTATFILPLGLLEDVEKGSAEFAARDERLVAAFCDAYPARVEEARTRLREEFDPRDYPPVAQVRGHFRARMAYYALGAPDNLRGVSDALYARERAKFAEALAETARDIRLVLREGMADLLDRMVARLSDRADGQRKQFRVTATQRALQDFLDTLPLRDLTGDADLAAVAGQVKGLLAGMDVERVKDDTRFREKVKAAFAATKDVVAALVVEAAPERRIVLED